MGLLDALTGLLSGSGTSTVRLDLEPGEAEITRAVASHRPGTLTSVGGDLILTDRRLVFTPLNVKDLTAVLTWGLGKAGAPDAAVRLVDQAGKLIDTQGLGSLSELTRVERGTAPSVLKPPTLLISGPAASWEIGILAGRRSPNFASANAIERDRMLEAIQAQRG